MWMFLSCLLMLVRFMTKRQIQSCLTEPNYSQSNRLEWGQHVFILFYLCTQVRFQYAFETVSGFILPYTVIVTSYILILRRLRQTKFRRKVRSEKLILAIVVMFGVFWLPYHVINMVQVCGFIRIVCMFTDLKLKLAGKRVKMCWHLACHNLVIWTNTYLLPSYRWQQSGTKRTRQ